MLGIISLKGMSSLWILGRLYIFEIIGCQLICEEQD